MYEHLYVHTYLHTNIYVYVRIYICTYTHTGQPPRPESYLRTITSRDVFHRRQQKSFQGRSYILCNTYYFFSRGRLTYVLCSFL